MPTVDSAGVPIAWDEVGSRSGRPVLLVHGFASNGAQNWMRSGWLDPLDAAGLRAIVVDLRGHGASGKPVGPERYRKEFFLRDLESVLDSAGVERAGYLGYSFGARLGWDLAIARPDRIDRLVLGGFTTDSPLARFDLAAARASVFRGTTVADPLTAGFLQLAALVPGNDIDRLLDVVEGVRSDETASVAAGPTPVQAIRIVNGERDTTAVGGGAFASTIGADYVELPARSHASAITSHRFKQAAVEWLTG